MLDRSLDKSIKEKVNIYNYPRRDPRYMANRHTQLTIGDLHANALKLVYFLIKHGVLALSKFNYRKLNKIYLKPIEKITKNDLKIFNTIIDKAKTKKVGLVRLLGDDLADIPVAFHF